MRNTELYYATTYCWANDIYVVVKPIGNTSKYKLAISRKGKEKTGHQVYLSTHQNLTVESKDQRTGKIIKNLVVIPPLHKKIEELYIDIYNKNFND